MSLNPLVVAEVEGAAAGSLTANGCATPADVLECSSQIAQIISFLVVVGRGVILTTDAKQGEARLETAGGSRNGNRRILPQVRRFKRPKTQSTPTDALRVYGSKLEPENKSVVLEWIVV